MLHANLVTNNCKYTQQRNSVINFTSIRMMSFEPPKRCLHYWLNGSIIRPPIWWTKAIRNKRSSGASIHIAYIYIFKSPCWDNDRRYIYTHTYTYFPVVEYPTNNDNHVVNIRNALATVATSENIQYRAYSACFISSIWIHDAMLVRRSYSSMSARLRSDMPCYHHQARCLRNMHMKCIWNKVRLELTGLFDSNANWMRASRHHQRGFVC